MVAIVVDGNVEPAAPAGDIFPLDGALEDELVVRCQHERRTRLAANSHLPVIVVACQSARNRHVAVDLGGAAAKTEIFGDDVALYLQQRRPVDVGFGDGRLRCTQRACDEERAERGVVEGRHHFAGQHQPLAVDDEIAFDHAGLELIQPGEGHGSRRDVAHVGHEARKRLRHGQQIFRQALPPDAVPTATEPGRSSCPWTHRDRFPFNVAVPELAIITDEYRLSRNPENPAGRTSAADGAARRDRGRGGPSPDWRQAAPRSRGQPQASRHRRRAGR